MSKFDKYMSVTEAAKKLGINRQAVYEAIKRGNIGCIKVGNMTLVKTVSVEKYKVNEKCKQAGFKSKDARQ
ncbi:MAG: Helix-turn-helix domain protein [Candidatus Scalindua rubra]|uniref:Helix-turn-helix domain protein n=1 Tax=Candidatus Scalindua rubra TaxID=1872076 RepID=A0A1E3XF21_9BACT|nr:MAG: Helix-turn-helix domain protein [Candidatus Scalindua rubra]